MGIAHLKNLLIAFLLCAKIFHFPWICLSFCLRLNFSGPLAFVLFHLKRILTTKRFTEFSLRLLFYRNQSPLAYCLIIYFGTLLSSLPMDFSFNAHTMVKKHLKNLLIAFLLCAKYPSFSLNMLLFLCLRPNNCGPLAIVFFFLKSNFRTIELLKEFTILKVWIPLCHAYLSLRCMSRVFLVKIT